MTKIFLHVGTTIEALGIQRITSIIMKIYIRAFINLISPAQNAVKYFPSDSHEAEHVCNNATTLFKETKTLALKLEHNDKAAKKDAKKKKKKKKRARKEK